MLYPLTDQVRINELSARVRGDKEEADNEGQQPLRTSVSEVKGSVSVRDGLAVLRRVSFRGVVPVN
jgi:hypothetical protein